MQCFLPANMHLRPYNFALTQYYTSFPFYKFGLRNYSSQSQYAASPPTKHAPTRKPLPPTHTITSFPFQVRFAEVNPKMRCFLPLNTNLTNPLSPPHIPILHFLLVPSLCGVRRAVAVAPALRDTGENP